MLLSISSFITGLLGFLGIGSLGLTEYKKQFDAINYGIKVKVDDLNMNVVISGEQHNQTIVLLPGLGEIVPYYTLKGITDELSEKYRMITVEPFGYGISDISKKERTTENIVAELHTGLEKLGVDKFYLMAHSLGGIYSLAYASKYPNEVLGFIGLDNTPNDPRMILDVSLKDKLLNEGKKILAKHHLWRFASDKDKYSLANFDPKKHTQEEINNFSIIFGYNFVNENIINENNHRNDNIEAVIGMTFNCPALMFTSTQELEYFPFWKTAHETMVGHPENSEVIELQGTHYIYADQGEYIVNKVKEWIK